MKRIYTKINKKSDESKLKRRKNQEIDRKIEEEAKERKH